MLLVTGQQSCPWSPQARHLNVAGSQKAFAVEHHWSPVERLLQQSWSRPPHEPQTPVLPTHDVYWVFLHDAPSAMQAKAPMAVIAQQPLLHWKPGQQGWPGPPQSVAAAGFTQWPPWHRRSLAQGPFEPPQRGYWQNRS
jgi:hypothetical protein